MAFIHLRRPCGRRRPFSVGGVPLVIISARTQFPEFCESYGLTSPFGRTGPGSARRAAPGLEVAPQVVLATPGLGPPRVQRVAHLVGCTAPCPPGSRHELVRHHRGSDPARQAVEPSPGPHRAAGAQRRSGCQPQGSAHHRRVPTGRRRRRPDAGEACAASRDAPGRRGSGRDACPLADAAGPPSEAGRRPKKRRSALPRPVL